MFADVILHIFLEINVYFMISLFDLRFMFVFISREPKTYDKTRVNLIFLVKFKFGYDNGTYVQFRLFHYIILESSPNF